MRLLTIVLSGLLLSCGTTTHEIIQICVESRTVLIIPKGKMGNTGKPRYYSYGNAANPGQAKFRDSSIEELQALGIDLDRLKEEEQEKLRNFLGN